MNVTTRSNQGVAGGSSAAAMSSSIEATLVGAKDGGGGPSKSLLIEGVNPLKSDAELSSLLKRLDKVKKYKSFQKWKQKFLDRLEQFLYEAGMKPAELTCDDFDDLLNKLVKKGAEKVLGHIERGELGDDRKTVKSSLALNEMCNMLTTVVSVLENLIPSNSKEEKKVGFTKFHLGAVLIRQGFHQYITMKVMEDALEEIGAKLIHVADRQQHELFATYTTQVQRFCAVMADLNLYEVMMKCLEFHEVPDEEESSSYEPVTILITVESLRDGKVLTLSHLDATIDAVGSVKDAIAHECRIPTERQVLKLKEGDGKPLDDDEAYLETVGIQDGAVLTVEPFRVPVTVNTMDGREIRLMVDPTDYLSDVKLHLEEESGIPAWNQNLLMNGQELEDDKKTAHDHGIRARSVLELEPRVISLEIEMPDGKETFSVDFKSSDTADIIKDKIADMTGMAAFRQVLKFRDKELPGNQTAKEACLRDGSRLSVEVFRVPVTVNTMDGRRLEVMVDPTGYLSDMKISLEGISGLPATNQKLSINGEELTDDTKKASDYCIKAGSVLDLEPKTITVNVVMSDGTVHVISVKPSDTTNSIKNTIANATGMAAPRQVVKIQGRTLPVEGTVRDMGIQEGSDLTVEVYRIPVTVNTMDGKQIKVMMDPTDYLSDVKVSLEGESGLPAKNQKLLLGGKELSDDMKTAAEYGLDAGSVLDLEPKSMCVNVEMPDGKTHAVEIKPLDTTEIVKAKISKQTGMAAPRQVLKFQGTVLPPGKLVKDMGIHDDSNIKVEIHKIPITVHTMDGKQIKIMIDPTETLSGVKRSLEGESGIPAENQELILNGQELMDDKKAAADHGIRAQSVLDLEPKTIQITAELPNGKTQAVAVKPSDTTEEIKEKIADESGVTPFRQVLKFQGKDLPLGRKARDMGIRDGSAITVGIHTIPVTVKTEDGKSLFLDVEPSGTIDAIKEMLREETGLEPKKQVLKFGEDELTNGGCTATECGIGAKTILNLSARADPIIFVDVKCGTLFAVDRDSVIERQVLTPRQNNRIDFSEAAKDSTSREKILRAMLESPDLGVATQVVVTKAEVEDYELEEAEKVKSMWGVNLKKREKNKKGEEFIFVDPKTGAAGELSRKKYVDMKFITPTVDTKGRETLEERETDTMMYDRYVLYIRNTFNVKSAT